MGIFVLILSPMELCLDSTRMANAQVGNWVRENKILCVLPTSRKLFHQVALHKHHLVWTNTPRWTKIILGNAVMLGKRGVIQTQGQNSSVNDSYWRFPKSTVHHKRWLLHTRGLSFYDSWQQACARPHLRVQNAESDGTLFKIAVKEALTLGGLWRNTETPLALSENIENQLKVFLRKSLAFFFFFQGLVYLRLALSSLCSWGWLWNVFRLN